MKLLSRRELSIKQLRDRLDHRGHQPDDIERAIQLLIEHRYLDDDRVARAYVRTAIKVKGRGRLRVQQELAAMGIDRQIVAAAVGEAFGEVDERAAISKAIEKKLRGRAKTPVTPAEYARLYQFLLRQGFSPAAVNQALRRQRRGGDEN